MHLSGLHLLLTYQCNFECDHCFVWGSPRQTGTMTLAQIEEILGQAAAVGTVEWVYFEGGEPFLYHPIVVRAAEEAVRRGFRVGVVSNGYWATAREDALQWLAPLAATVQDLSISSDLYHSDERLSEQARTACAAAQQLDIHVDVISIAQPEDPGAPAAGQLLAGESGVMYRGRAAHRLAPLGALRAWDVFVECPYEDLREPGRVHVDPFGYVHLCQGISLGNLFERPLRDICDSYNPEKHPVVDPLLKGGPCQLVQCYQIPHADAYADACHLCYEARVALRERFPGVLVPDQMYGMSEGV